MKTSNATVVVYGFRLSTYFVDIIRTAPRNDARVATRSLIEQCSRVIIEDAPFSKRGLIEISDLDDLMIDEETLGQELDNAEIEDEMLKEIIEEEEDLETVEEGDLEMVEEDGLETMEEEEEEYLETMEDVYGVLFTFLIFMLICRQRG